MQHKEVNYRAISKFTEILSGEAVSGYRVLEILIYICRQ